MATLKVISSLRPECDWLMKYFDVRKDARVGEMDSLIKAKAVLSGTDYSLMQAQECTTSWDHRSGKIVHIQIKREK